MIRLGTNKSTTAASASRRLGTGTTSLRRYPDSERFFSLGNTCHQSTNVKKRSVDLQSFSSSSLSRGPARQNYTTWHQQQQNQLRQQSPMNILFRPIVFTISLCLGSFGYVAIWKYEKQQTEFSKWKRQEQLLEKQRSQQSVWERAKRTIIRSTSQQTQQHNDDSLAPSSKPPFWTTLPLNTLSKYLPKQVVRNIQNIADDPSCSTVGPIIATNIILHGMFLIPNPRIQYMKYKYFIHNSRSNRCLPMVLSTFAHGNIIHLAMNCYVLWQFGDDVARGIVGGGKEQFWAAYVCAGTIASLGSTTYEVTKDVLRRAMNLTVRATPGSLGASGAIYAIVFAFGLTYDDMPVWVMGIGPFTIGDAIRYLAGFDVFGLLVLGSYSSFGHAAHLSGAAAGYYATKLDGIQHIDRYQRWVLDQYKQLKHHIGY